MRVVLLTGKGGVGKTTHAITTALGAAARGHRVFLLSTDAAHSVGDALGRPVGARPVPIAEGVVAQEVSALDELDRSWGALQKFLRQLLKEETDELVAEELLVFPGLEELIALRAIRDVEATGAGGLVPGEEMFDAFERLWSDVDDVREILMDTSRTTARLVVNPTQVVLEEARRSFAYLSLYGVATDGVIVNRVLPRVAGQGWFGRWAAREQAMLEEIRTSFPIPRIEVPLEPRELTGLPALQALAGRLYTERDPAALWRQGRPIRLRTHSGHPRLEIELPGATKEALEVDARGDSLVIRLRDASRIVALPRSLVGRPIRRARLREGLLSVDFE